MLHRVSRARIAAFAHAARQHHDAGQHRKHREDVDAILSALCGPHVVAAAGCLPALVDAGVVDVGEAVGGVLRAADGGGAGAQEALAQCVVAMAGHPEFPVGALRKLAGVGAVAVHTAVVKAMGGLHDGGTWRVLSTLLTPATPHLAIKCMAAAQPPLAEAVVASAVANVLRFPLPTDAAKAAAVDVLLVSVTTLRAAPPAPLDVLVPPACALVRHCAQSPVAGAAVDACATLALGGVSTHHRLELAVFLAWHATQCSDAATQAQSVAVVTSVLRGVPLPPAVLGFVVACCQWCSLPVPTLEAAATRVTLPTTTFTTPTSGVLALLVCDDVDALSAWLLAAANVHPGADVFAGGPFTAGDPLPNADLVALVAAALCMHPAPDACRLGVTALGAASLCSPMAVAGTLPALRTTVAHHADPSVRAAAITTIALLCAVDECAPTCTALLHPLLSVPPAVTALAVAAGANHRLRDAVCDALMCLSATATGGLHLATVAAMRDVADVYPRAASAVFPKAAAALLGHGDVQVVAAAVDLFATLCDADCMATTEGVRVVVGAGVLRRALDTDAGVVAVPVCRLLACAVRELEEAAGAPPVVGSDGYTPVEDACLVACRHLWGLLRHPTCPLAVTAAADAMSSFPVWMLGFEDKYLGGSDAPPALPPTPDSPLELQFAPDGRILKPAAVAVLMAALHVGGGAAPHPPVALLVHKVLAAECRRQRWSAPSGTPAAEPGAELASLDALRAAFGADIDAGLASVLGSHTHPSSAVAGYAAPSTKRGTKGALASGLLWCYHPTLSSPPRKGSSRQIVRPKALAGTASQYLLTFRDLLCDVSWGAPATISASTAPELDAASCLVAASGWLAFMRRLVVATANAAVVHGDTPRQTPVDGPQAVAVAVADARRTAVPHLVAAGAVLPGVEPCADPPASPCAGFNAALALGGAGAAAGGAAPHAVGGVVDLLLAAAAPESRCDVTTRVGVLLGLAVAAASLPPTDVVRVKQAFGVLATALRGASTQAATVSVTGGFGTLEWLVFAASVGLGCLSAFCGQGLMMELDVPSVGDDVHAKVVNALYSASNGAPALPRVGACLGLAAALQSVPQTEAAATLLHQTVTALHHDVAMGDSTRWLALLPAAPFGAAVGAVPPATAAAVLDAVHDAVKAPSSHLMLVLPDYVAALAGHGVAAESWSALCDEAAAAVSAPPLEPGTRLGAVWGAAGAGGGRPLLCGVTSVRAGGDGQGDGWRQVFAPCEAVQPAVVAAVSAPHAPPLAAVAAAPKAGIRGDPVADAATAASGVLSRAHIHPAGLASPFVAPASGASVAFVGSAAGGAGTTALPDVHAACPPDTLAFAVLRQVHAAGAAAGPPSPSTLRWLAAAVRSLTGCRLPPVPVGRLLERLFVMAGGGDLQAAAVGLGSATAAADVSAAQWAARLAGGGVWARLTPGSKAAFVHGLPALKPSLPPTRWSALAAGLSGSILREEGPALGTAVIAALSACGEATTLSGVCVQAVCDALPDAGWAALDTTTLWALGEALSGLPPDALASALDVTAGSPRRVQAVSVLRSIVFHVSEASPGAPFLAACRAAVLTPAAVMASGGLPDHTSRWLTVLAAVSAASARLDAVERAAWVAACLDSALVLAMPPPGDAAPPTASWLALYALAHSLTAWDGGAGVVGGWRTASVHPLVPPLPDATAHARAAIAALPLVLDVDGGVRGKLAAVWKALQRVVMSEEDAAYVVPVLKVLLGEV